MRLKSKSLKFRVAFKFLFASSLITATILSLKTIGRIIAVAKNKIRRPPRALRTFFIENKLSRESNVLMWKEE